MVTSTSCHRVFAYEITYQVPCTSGYRKILAFWYKQKPVPQKKKQGPRRSLRGLLTDHNAGPPQPTPHAIPWQAVVQLDERQWRV